VAARLNKGNFVPEKMIMDLLGTDFQYASKLLDGILLFHLSLSSLWDKGIFLTCLVILGIFYPTQTVADSATFLNQFLAIELIFFRGYAFTTTHASWDFRLLVYDFHSP